MLKMLGLFFFVVQVAIMPTIDASEKAQRSFIIDYERNCFLKDNEPFRYISGEMHYFRIPSIYWKDRLMKAKALGVNTIQTYVAWNVHEVAPLQYDFSGEKDLLSFIDIAHELGLLVIVRPGPYICAEWDFGGFPAWLAKNESLKIRTSDPAYMHYVEVWFYALLPMLKNRLYGNGGPIIAFQVENEYGFFHECDPQYLPSLKKIFHSHYGDDVVLFTVDNYSDKTLQCGTSSELFTTIDFGLEIEPSEAFKQQRKYQNTGPFVNTEFYVGWFDVWGKPHQKRDGKLVAEQLDKILALNASVNMYMLHGGTNFGYMNGAQANRLLDTTSYDYDAPINEAGDTTWKYHQIRDVLKKYVEMPTDPIPKNTTKASYGPVETTAYYNFNKFIEVVYSEYVPYQSETPMTMEEMDLAYGYANYRTFSPAQYLNKTVKLTIDHVSDRTMILVDGDLVAIEEIPGHVELTITLGTQLDIFIENQGRQSFPDKNGQLSLRQRGIVGNVRVTNIPLVNWTNYAINETKFRGVHEQILTMLSSVHSSSGKVSKVKNENNIYMNTFYGFLFLENEFSDTFLALNGFKKGHVFVNNFNIGRFWMDKGPQKTLFVPKNVFRIGLNTVTIISLDKVDSEQTYYNFVKEPIFSFDDGV